MSPDIFNEDDREEGEIVDDEDGFESISDDSISLEEESAFMGKSLSHRSYLRTLSLSSISDTEEHEHVPKTSNPNCKTYGRTQITSKRENTPKHCDKRCATYVQMSDDSDGENSIRLSKKIQKQLRNAVRIETSEAELHRKSLRSRLGCMIKSNDCRNKDTTINNELDKLDLKDDKLEKSDNYDNDLEFLRLEALRTAIINKYKHKLKRKAHEMEIDSEVLVNPCSQENKFKKPCLDEFNNTPVISKVSPKLTISNNVTSSDDKSDQLSSPIEEDEDVLRALVLASMTNKISKEKSSEKLNNNCLTNVPQKQVEVKEECNSSEPLNKNTNKTPTANSHPLDIKNTDNKSKVVTAVKKVPNNKVTIKESCIVNKNNNRLKCVKSKKMNYTKQSVCSNLVLLPPIKPIIINVNGDSDSDDDLFEQSAPIPKIKNNENHKLDIKDNKKNCSTDVHLDTNPTLLKNKLDENKIIDFLKQERAKVETDELALKSSKSLNSSKSSILEKSALKLLPEDKQIEYRMLKERLKKAQKCHTKLAPVKENALPKKINPLKLKANQLKQEDKAIKLDKVINDMQFRSNGKLQIKNIYEPLNPLVKKINATKEETKMHSINIKRLLKELSEARSKLLNCEQEFKTLKAELLVKKALIDKGHNKLPSKQLVTSTPEKRISNTQNNSNKLLIKNKPNLDRGEHEVNEEAALRAVSNQNVLNVKNTITEDGFKLQVVTETDLHVNDLCKEVDKPISCKKSLERSPIIAKKNDIVGCNMPEVFSKEQERNTNDIHILNVCTNLDARKICIESSEKSKTKAMYNEAVNCNVFEMSKKLKVSKYVSPLGPQERFVKNINPLAVLCPYSFDGTCRDPECKFSHLITGAT